MRPIPESRRTVLLCLLVWLLVVPSPAVAHGSVTAGEDLCQIRIGYFTAHFKIYLPRSHGHEQFCEDLPVAGETIFVMEYEHAGLNDTPIDFRIIENTTGQGRYTRARHVENIADLEAYTVFHHPPGRQQDVFTALHQFDTAGEYVGIVTIKTTDGARARVAVFPFEVGYTGLGLWPWFALAALVLQLNYLRMSGWFKTGSWRRMGLPSLMAALLTLGFTAPPVATADADSAGWLSRNGQFRLQATPEIDPVVINRIHNWTLILSTPAGAPVSGASITVTGGMPVHDHGLPTSPRVSDEPVAGRYLLEGMRFHMHGEWVVAVLIETDGVRDLVEIRLTL